ncbi:MAG: DUF4352 domain-containing protein [Chloroflexi bacterium]|nr:DUF4352 domain-containing protein [Chloroflexota bacterium]
MSAEPAPAPKKSNRKPLIITLAVILGFAALCTVLNWMGSNNVDFANPAPPTPPFEQTAAWQTALAHLAAVATKWSAPTSSGPTPTPQFAKVGDRMDPGPFAVTVTDAETAASYGGQTAQAGNKFVAAQVLLESKDTGGLYISPAFFTLKDSDGIQYVATQGQTPAFSSDVLLPNGQQANGWVTFEVPEGAHGFILTFDSIKSNPPVLIPILLGF